MSAVLIDHLRDLFAPLGAMSTRAMFGGHALYVDGLLVGLVLGDVLYLKVDAQTRPYFEAAGCAPCIYGARRTPLSLSYWSVPDAALDCARLMEPWAQRAIDAARRKEVSRRTRSVPRRRR